MIEKQRSLGERLRTCMEDGRLSISDLHVWLGKSRGSVQNWARFDQQPRAEYYDEVLRRTKQLEMLIRKTHGPLVPYTVGADRRPIYIRQLYNALNKRVSEKNPPL